MLGFTGAVLFGHILACSPFKTSQPWQCGAARFMEFNSALMVIFFALMAIFLFYLIDRPAPAKREGRVILTRL
jgi:hypothetical protein